MDTCKICGGEFQRLSIHVLQKHGMKMDQYEALPENEFTEDMEELPAVEDEGEQQENVSDNEQAEREKKATIPEDEKVKNIFGTNEAKHNPADEPIRTLLQEFNLSLTTLRSIVKNYVNGEVMQVNQKLELKQKLGQKNAADLADQKEVVVNNINTAEELVNVHGFEVIKVTSNPKSWHLVNKLL